MKQDTSEPCNAAPLNEAGASKSRLSGFRQIIERNIQLNESAIVRTPVIAWPSPYNEIFSRGEFAWNENAVEMPV